MKVFDEDTIAEFENYTIIGFAGTKRCGKDTAGSVVENTYGFTQEKLTAPVKETVKTVFAFDDITGASKDETDEFWGISPRQAMQLVATDFFQDQFDADIWVKSLARRMKSSSNHEFVVTDLRYPRQCFALQQLGGKVFYIKRPEVEHELSSLKKLLSQVLPSKLKSWLPMTFEAHYHPSEIAMLDSSYADNPDILNEGLTIDEYRSLVSDKIGEYLSRESHKSSFTRALSS